MKRLTRCTLGALLAGLLWLGLGQGTAWGAGLLPGLATAQWVAYLPPGNAITDGRALLRYSLPIDSPDLRKVQGELEGLSQWLRSNRWGPLQGELSKVQKTLSRRRERILAAVPEADRDRAATLLEDLTAAFPAMFTAIENRDKDGVRATRSVLLDYIGDLEALMVEGFPFEVPEEYATLPQLRGRATVRFNTTQGPVTAVIDGYSAPVTAGNFVDLVQRGFYNHMPFIRAEDNYVLQTGDPVGSEEGFIDPKTGEYRTIPLEIMVKGDAKPVYGATLEELGRYLEEPVLPFSAYGTLGMARPETEPNGGSSQFFFFLFEPELTPAGLNLLDGRYAVFGYVVAGQDALGKLRQGDEIESAEVIAGAENLVQPTGV